VYRKRKPSFATIGIWPFLHFGGVETLRKITFVRFWIQDRKTIIQNGGGDGYDFWQS
jgi:hypothetical protein